jgi:hypothetical protein
MFTHVMQAAAAAAAAAAPGRQGCLHSGSSAGGSNESSAAAAAAAGAHECIGSTLGSLGPGFTVAGFSRCSSCGGSQQSITASLASSAAAAAGAGAGFGCSGSGCSGSNALEHRMQLLSLAQSMQRPRAVSGK